MRARADSVARTRQDIVRRAADRLRRSPEPVTLVEIAAAAGVSRTTVYRHFRSITGLLDAVAADLLSRARFDQLLAAVSLPDPVAAVAEVTTLGCGIWALDQDLVRNLFALARAQADALPVIDQLEAGRVQVMEHLAGRLDDAGALAAGLDQRDAVDLLVAATGFAGWDQIVTARRRPPATATKLIVRMALRAVT
jgi:AcrR family transcriptional regulator